MPTVAALEHDMAYELVADTAITRLEWSDETAFGSLIVDIRSPGGAHGKDHASMRPV